MKIFKRRVVIIITWSCTCTWNVRIDLQKMKCFWTLCKEYNIHEEELFKNMWALNIFLVKYFTSNFILKWKWWTIFLQEDYTESWFWGDRIFWKLEAIKKMLLKSDFHRSSQGYVLYCKLILLPLYYSFSIWQSYYLSFTL